MAEGIVVDMGEIEAGPVFIDSDPTDVLLDTAQFAQTSNEIRLADKDG